MNATILAAIDPLGPLDRAPLDLALTIAESTGARVIGAAVFPWSTAEGTQPLNDLRRDLGVEIRTLVDLSPARALHELASELEASLIVVGSTQSGALGRVFLGTTAEAMVNGSPCSVVVARRGDVSAVSTVAVGFADTPEGHAALTAAHAVAARADARLRVVAVLHPSGGFDAQRMPPPRPPRGALLEGRHRIEAQTALDRAVAGLAPGVDVDTELHVDDPGDVLLRLSEHVDLLVCGSRGYGPLHSVLVGGVSHRLLRASACPVLVVPRGVEHPLASLLGLRDATVAS